MSSEKTTQPSLKGLDAFQIRVIEFLNRMAQNPKPIIVTLGIALAVLGGVYGVRYLTQKKQEDRKIELSKIDQVYDSEIKALNKQREDLQKRRDSLKAAQPTPAAAAGSPEKPVEDSPEIKALDAQIQDLKPDHKNSSAQYKAYFEKNTDNPEGLVAGLKYAAYAAEQKQLPEAEGILEKVVNGSQSYSIINTQGLLLLIAVLEDQNKFDKALEYADKFLKSASDELKPRALLTKGQIYFLKKDYKNAQSTLNQLTAEHETSMEADRARSLMALIPQQS